MHAGVGTRGAWEVRFCLCAIYPWTEHQKLCVVESVVPACTEKEAWGATLYGHTGR